MKSLGKDDISIESFVYVWFYPLFHLCSLPIYKRVKANLVTVVKSNPKAPFSIATTPRYRGGPWSFPWIAPLYLWYVQISSTIFFSLWYDPTWDWTLVWSYQRLKKKWYLIVPCLTLNIIRYVSRLKCSNPGKWVTPSPTPWCDSYWKKSLWVTLDYSCQLYFYLYKLHNESLIIYTEKIEQYILISLCWNINTFLL